MRIYEAQSVTGNIVWTTYTSGGAVYEGRGFLKADWKKRVAAQKRYAAAERRWIAADARFTAAMKESRYAIVNHLGWSDARLERYEIRMQKAMAAMDAATAEMNAAEKEVEAL